MKTTFEASNVIQPIYTGGSVALSEDGRILVSTLGEEAVISDLETGEQLGRLDSVRTSPDSRTICLSDVLTYSAGWRIYHYFGL